MFNNPLLKPRRFGPPYCPSPLPLSRRCYNRCIASPRCCEYPPCRNPLLVDGCCNTSTDLSSRWVSPSGCRNSPQRNKSCCCICPCGNFDIEPEPQETQESSVLKHTRGEKCKIKQQGSKFSLSIPVHV